MTHRWYQGRGVRIGAVIVLAAVAAFLVWFFAIRDSGGGNVTIKAGHPTEVSDDTSGVADVANAAAHPVYWVGPQPGTKLEATLLTNGQAYVRYLTAGAPIGSPKPDYLTVGTYPVTNGYKALTDVSKQPGEIVDKAPNGALVVTNKSAPNSVYMAFRGQDLEVEIYDPNPDRALQLATSGAVVPVD